MSGLFGSKPPPPPPIPPPVPMPDPEGPEVREAQRKRALEIAQRSGRRSTILTSDEDRGGSYSKRTLGGG